MPHALARRPAEEGRAPGAVLVRRLLPATIGIPLVLVLLHEAGHRGWIPTPTSGLLFLAVGAALGSLLVLGVGRALDREHAARLQAQEQLRHRAEQHRLLARSYPGGAIVLFDDELRHVIADGDGLAAVGLSAERMEGRTIWEVFAPEVCTAIEPPFRAALEGVESSFEQTYRGFHYVVQVVPVRDDAGGRPLGAAIVTDVTAKRRQEEQLREAEERFHRFFDHAPIGEAIVGLDGRFLQVNPALCAIVGYDEAELMQLTFQDITHPEDLAEDLELTRRVVAREIPSYQLEKRYVRRDGEIVWIQLSVSFVRTTTGAPLYFISQIEDITERRRAAERLEESERNLAEAQRIAQVGSWEWHVAANTVRWSDELHRIYGTTPGEVDLSYETFLERLHPDDRASAEEAVTRAFETGEPFAYEHRIVRPDGEVRTLQAQGRVEQGPDGRPVRMLGIGQDVTERLRADTRLREAEARYRALAEQLPLVTYVRPLEPGPLIYVSPQVEEMLGHPAEAWLADPGLLERSVHPEDRERVLAGIARGSEVVRDEVRLVARDGRVIWAQVAELMLKNALGSPEAIQGYVIDVSERKYAEVERDRLRDDLYQAQKVEAIGRLAAGVAHELNNALMAVSGHAGLLESQLARTDPIRRDVEQILASADRAATVTRQLLAFGRRQVLQPRALDINDAVRGCARLLRPLLEERIALETELDDTLPDTLADPGQLEQVIVNLVLNSRDAISGRGTITVRTAGLEVGEGDAAARGVSPGPYVAIVVADDGSGIEPETAERIFEPFFTTKDVGAGTGLGLSTVDGIVRQEGGFVAVDTAPGEGTTVTVALPLRGATDEPAELAPSPAGAVRAGGRRALVVDDEEVVREICAELIASMGYEVTTAADGAEALAALARDRTPLDLLVTDVLMPRVDGAELARAVAERSPGTAIVLMSGHPGDRLPELAGETFLQKPFGRAELAAAVEATRSRIARPA